jgi:hypothetical protein
LTPAPLPPDRSERKRGRSFSAIQAFPERQRASAFQTQESSCFACPIVTPGDAKGGMEISSLRRIDGRMADSSPVDRSIDRSIDRSDGRLACLLGWMHEWVLPFLSTGGLPALSACLFCQPCLDDARGQNRPQRRRKSTGATSVRFSMTAPCKIGLTFDPLKVDGARSTEPFRCCRCCCCRRKRDMCSQDCDCLSPPWLSSLCGDCISVREARRGEARGRCDRAATDVDAAAAPAAAAAVKDRLPGNGMRSVWSVGRSIDRALRLSSDGLALLPASRC